jgi:hypothetical protein
MLICLICLIGKIREIMVICVLFFKKESNYASSRSLSLSKAKADGANRFGFDRLSRR